MTQFEDTYSDKALNKSIKLAKKWSKEFKKTPQFAAFSDYEKENANFTIELFTEMMYNYHLQEPADWDQAAMQDVVCNLFPRKVAVEQEFFQSTAKILQEYFLYLFQEHYLQHGELLAKAVKACEFKIIENSNNSGMFGIGKSILSHAKFKGLKMETEDDIRQIMMDYNENINNYPIPALPERQKIGRNDPCPCGSGKKYKKCCLNLVRQIKLNLSNWYPSLESMENFKKSNIENVLNTHLDQLNGITLFEELILHGFKSPFMKHLLSNQFIQEQYGFLNKIISDHSYSSIKNRTGGLLNAFHSLNYSLFDQSIEDLRANKISKEDWLGKTSMWSDLPHKLIWCGGGQLENLLTLNFYQVLTNKYDGQPFSDEQEAIRLSSEVLEKWKTTPNEICAGKIPITAIIEDRNKIYQANTQLLQKHNIQSEFIL